MKIILKDADFSQSGIPTPHEVVFDGSKYLNSFTGALGDNTDTARGADLSKIPMNNKKIIVGETSGIFPILFYAADDTYLGCVSFNGVAGYAIIVANSTFRIDEAEHYVKPSGGSLVEMTAQEVAALKANAAYWMLSAQAGSGTIANVQVTLEIVD